MFGNIIKDTLKVNGKWSRKSLTMFVSFANMIGLIWVDTITKMPIIAECCRIPIDYTLVLILGCMATGQSMLNVYESIKGIGVPEAGDNKGKELA